MIEILFSSVVNNSRPTVWVAYGALSSSEKQPGRNDVKKKKFRGRKEKKVVREGGSSLTAMCYSSCFSNPIAIPNTLFSVLFVHFL